MLSPSLGILFILLQTTCAGLSIYHTKKLLKDNYHKTNHFWHFVFLQVVTVVISLAVIAHVIEAIG